MGIPYSLDLRERIVGCVEHPERAWQAFSQWRSSWLSRENIAAVVTFVPVALFAFYWTVAQITGGLVAALGLVASLCCLATVVCTAMIYASLRSIPAWSSRWTLPGYLMLAALSGALLLNLLLQAWSLPLAERFAWVVLMLLVPGAAVKLLYWHSVERGVGRSTAESATGLGGLGRVRLLEAPHCESSYLMQEMGYRIARKHAAKLRRIALVAGCFALPALLTALAVLLPSAVAIAVALLSVALVDLGLAVERWLFFVKAKHFVTLYYGESHALIVR